MHNEESRLEKAPGIRARKRGTKLKRGAAVQVMCYPRPKTKAVLVEASREVGLSLSSFILLGSLRAVAALRGCAMENLVPPEELQRYRAYRIDRKRKRNRGGKGNGTAAHENILAAHVNVEWPATSSRLAAGLRAPRSRRPQNLLW